MEMSVGAFKLSWQLSYVALLRAHHQGRLVRVSWLTKRSMQAVLLAGVCAPASTGRPH
jgi:hypothetical protein